MVLMSCFFIVKSNLSYFSASGLSINTIRIEKKLSEDLYKQLIDGINGGEPSDYKMNHSDIGFVEIGSWFNVKRKYMFAYDLEKEQLYFSHDRMTYSITDENLSAILLSQEFDYLYRSRKILSPIVSIAGEKKQVEYAYDWDYRKFKDNSQHAFMSFLVGETSKKIKDIQVLEKDIPVVIELNIMADDIILRDKAGNDLNYRIEGQTILLETPEIDGLYDIEINLIWENKDYSGQMDLGMVLDVDYPVEFILDKDEIMRGEFAKLIALNADEEDALFIDQSLDEYAKFMKIGESYVCLLASTYYTKTGDYELIYGSNGDHYEKTLKVIPRDFNTQYLVINETTAKNTKNDEARAQFNTYYAPVKKVSDYPEPTAYDQFILPVKGRLSTEFGVTRHVNGSLVSYNHSGLDIATSRGTEVVATARGKIVLSMDMILTGKTVVIDHGNGLLSSYYHMDTRNYEDGEVVAQGQVIGTVGTTGFSTGPHLHFMISYFTKNMDPGYFIYGEPVTYKNYKELFNRN